MYPSHPIGSRIEQICRNLIFEEINSNDPAIRGQLALLISWIPASKNFENDIDLDENQGPIERSSQFCDQCQTKELTNFAFDVR